MKNVTRFQVSLSALPEQQDSRFIRVKIPILHLGRNTNGSYLDRPTVEKAIPSLANVPILGFISEDGGHKDFVEHQEELVIKNGEKEWRYLGHAYGFIPEDNNARFEDLPDSSGDLRSYLVVEGVIWTKFKDAVEILLSGNPSPQSMEITDDYSGEMKDDGYFHFSDLTFDGACILGKDFEPAMDNSRIEIIRNFSAKSVMAKVNTQLEDEKRIAQLFSSVGNLISTYEKQSEDIVKVNNLINNLEKLIRG